MWRDASFLPLIILAGCAHGPRGAPDLPAFDPGRDLGLVFVQGGTDEAVLYHPRGATPAPGTAVVIALPRERTMLRRTVTRPVTRPETYVQQPFGPGTRMGRVGVRLASGGTLPGLGIAVIGRPVRLQIRGGVIEGDLDRVPPLESFRACASSEGAHLSVWSGRPLAGRRLWHVYYYLGYDTALDCTPGDYR